MTEFDSLERELAAMRPRQHSAELNSRIAASLEPAMTRPMRSTRQSAGRRVAMIGGLVAACLAAVAIWLANRSQVDTHSQDGRPESLLATAFDPTFPSVWTYRHAVIHSPDSLDALLERHAKVTRESRRDSMPLHAFARLDSKTNDNSGEL
jgi:hypothetical protein